MRHIAIPSLALTALLSCPGCFVTMEQGQQFQADINNLVKQNQQLKRSQEEFVARTAQRLKELSNRTEEIAKTLEYLDSSAHRGTADVGFQVESLKKELATLRDEIDINTNGLEKMGKRVEQVEQDVQTAATQTTPPPPPLFFNDDKAAKTENNQTDTKTAVKQSKPEVKKEEKKEEKKETPKKLTTDEKFAEAENLLKSKNYQGAMKLYNTLGANDKAYFGIAQCMSGMGHFTAALDKYEEIVTKFPKSSLKEEAIYQMCVNADKSGDKQLAKGTCEIFISQFPQSTYVAQVKKLIKKNDPSTKKKKK